MRATTAGDCSARQCSRNIEGRFRGPELAEERSGTSRSIRSFHITSSYFPIASGKGERIIHSEHFQKESASAIIRRCTAPARRGRRDERPVGRRDLRGLPRQHHPDMKREKDIIHPEGGRFGVPLSRAVGAPFPPLKSPLYMPGANERGRCRRRQHLYS